jgi:hypothetical protein
MVKAWNNDTSFPFCKLMVFQAPLGKHLLALTPVVAVIAMFAGCIADPIVPFQVVPETVVAPQNPFFQAVNYVQFSSPPQGQMYVKWNRSVADTQLNFKGYFLQLYTSHPDPSLLFEDLDSLVDTASIFHLPGKRTDTFYTFKTIQTPHIPGAAVSIPLGRYTIKVKSLKTSASDTTIYSVDSSLYSAFYDPLPMQNPSNLVATSINATTVALRWTLPVTDKDTGFYRYVVYYKDTTINDTGHVATYVPKGTNTVSFSVPPATGSTVTATEWPYEFWVKSQRIDSTFFYGPDMYGPDTNQIVWAGAEAVPRNGNETDSSLQGYLQVLNGKSMYFGSLNAQWDVAEDSSSTNNTGQVLVSINSGIVTLSVQSYNSGLGGVGFLVQNGSPRMDADSSLDSVFYTGPLNNPSQFTATSITLPATATNGGVIVYLMMNDDQTPQLGHQWARILIRAQSNGTFVNLNGGIDIKGSFQPGVTKDGSRHLPFY